MNSAHRSHRRHTRPPSYSDGSRGRCSWLPSRRHDGADIGNGTRTRAAGRNGVAICRCEFAGGYPTAKSQVAVAKAPRRVGADLPLVAAEKVRRNDPGFSTRQAAILQALIDGVPNKVIAQQLKLSEATVKLRVKAVLKKTNVRNRTQAAVWAIKQTLNTNASSQEG